MFAFLLFSVVGYLICSIPIFWILQSIQAWWILLPLVIFFSVEQAVMPIAIVEMFPGKGRYIGISIGYNICMALVGGFSPAMNTWAIHYFHSNMMLAYYVMFCAFVSLFVVLKYLPREYGLYKSLVSV